MVELLSSKDAERRIDEIAEELARGISKSKGQSIIELRKLCGKHRTVPTSYELEGVEKEGGWAQRTSPATEIWKGTYKDEVVALKVIRVPRDDPYVLQRTKSRFCKEVVLMKQLEHRNILPFYGVSTTVSDFCLVFPWYKNGNIMEYLKKNTDIDRLKLLSDAASGLLFLHESRLVHDSLRPSQILIDDGGTARLSTGGRSSIVAAPGTSIAAHVQSEADGDIDDYVRYMAPEIITGFYDGNGDKILATKESDVYGMGMVAYEVFAGYPPYSGYRKLAMLEGIRVGEPLQRPPEIGDDVWEFLQKCRSNDPSKRPSTAKVYLAFSRSGVLPNFTPTLKGQSATGLPRNVKLQVQSIKFSSDKSKQQQVSVKLKYGNKEHTTSLMKFSDTSAEHTWSVPEIWSFETDRQYRRESVSLELVLRAGIFKKDKTCATGTFSLLNNINKETYVKLEAPDSAGSAVLKILLTGV